MKLYIAEQDDWDASNVVGVFSTLEGASALFGLKPEEFVYDKALDFYFHNLSDGVEAEIVCVSILVCELDVTRAIPVNVSELENASTTSPKPKGD